MSEGFNFSNITDRLGVGTTPDDTADVQALTVAGYTHIINCRDDLDIFPLLKGSKFEVGYNWRYLWDGTEDWIPGANQHKGTVWFQNACAFYLPLLWQANTKCYVFCIMGANRSATMGWALLRATGLSPVECFQIMDTHRAIAIPGLLECGWWKDADVALQQLGFIGNQTELRELLNRDGKPMGVQQFHNGAAGRFWAKSS